MELKKPQFLEDYAYEKDPEDHKKQLLNTLFDKNKMNGEQIKSFKKKYDIYKSQQNLVSNPSSDENHSVSMLIH